MNLIRHRYVLLAAAALLAAACSVSRLAYLNAPPLALWYLGGYVDMTDTQKSFAKDRLTRAMAWHRQQELPDYQRTLDGLLAKGDMRVSAEEARSTYAKVRDYYHRSVEHLLPDFADLLLMLDASQVAHIEKKFADDNGRMLKESVKGTPEQRRERRGLKFVEQFEDWTGRLSPSQRAIVLRGMDPLAEGTEERLGDRRYRQAEIVRIIRTKPPRDEAIATLRKLFIDTESWRRPEYTRVLRERDERVVAVVAELSATLTPDQREHLQKKLRGYSNDISSIVAAR